MSAGRWEAFSLAGKVAVVTGRRHRPRPGGLMLEADGSPTARAQTIVAHTPLGRLGEAADLSSTVVWRAPGARHVTGVVVSVDGGFGAFSGV